MPNYYEEAPRIVQVREENVAPGMMAIYKFDMWAPPVQVVAVHSRPPQVDVTNQDGDIMRGMAPEVYMFFTQI